MITIEDILALFDDLKGIVSDEDIEIKKKYVKRQYSYYKKMGASENLSLLKAVDCAKLIVETVKKAAKNN